MRKVFFWPCALFMMMFQSGRIAALIFALLFVPTFSLFSQVDLNLGLKAYYPFSGNTNDASGNGLNAVPVGGPQLTTDRFGNPNSAYLFDGIDDRMIVTDNGALSTPAISICYYFNTEVIRHQVAIGKINFSNGNGATYNSAIYNQAAPPSFQSYWSILDGTTPCNSQIPTTFAYSIFSPQNIQTNRWYCVVNTFENGVQRLYIDGILVFQYNRPFLNGKFCSNTNFLIGSWWQNDLLPFKGKIDDIRVYNRAINAEEVAALCNTTTETVINDYTPALALDPCTNILTVEDAGSFNPGDTVLLIQMKGAEVDQSNTASFGTITNYRNSGNYEFNYVKSKSGNTIELKNVLTKQYDFADGKVQLVRVPYFQNYNSTSTLTCAPWDGSKGGVLVVNVQNNLTLNAGIDVSQKGFRGGTNGNNLTNLQTCSQTGYAYPSASPAAAPKGEGITTVPNTLIKGRGPLANGGGGGNDHNSGGAGGGNGAIGGNGGYQFMPCTNSNFDNKGLAGKDLIYSNTQNRIYMGGGGGSGHANNNPGQFNPNGGNGGGIAFIICGNLQSNGYTISANGGNGTSCTPNAPNNNCNEGMGGGGAGGCVLIQTGSYLDPVTVNTRGGYGANVVFYDVTAPPNFKHGPGGGGSGGILWLSNPSLPPFVTPNAQGGGNGINVFFGSDPFGATQGSNGNTLFNLTIPIDNTPFKKNIDSVRFNHSFVSCNQYSFSGLAYTNTNPVTQWNWDFGDGNTASTQNANHTYASPGTYQVKLVSTDINGCKDSITKSVTVVCPASVIINDYTPVLGLDICRNILTVADATRYNPGDTVLLIQMKGAEINTTNTASFGSITDYRGAGNYEINYVKAKTGNDIELKNVITRSYNIPDGKVQLVRVPYYKSPAFTEVLTCKPWDGSSGGILVLNASDTIHLNANIDVTGKGFSGGRVQNTNLNATNCQQNGYAYPTPSILAAPKGESITTISNSLTSGKGSLAAAGGGGLDHNSGGGGGSNATPGGFGGYQLFECINAIFDNRGIGGNPLVYNNVQNKIFLGSGGGAGHCNNGFSSPTSNTNFDGGNGGGMVILISDYLEGNGNSINALGDSAYELAGTGGETHDGMGGGGSGGTVLVYANNYLTSTIINVTGGKGGDMHASLAGGRIGPGGGGAGGVAWFKQAAVPAGISVINTGGTNGVLLQGGNSPHGATPGSDGANFFGLSVPVDNIPFKKNIDSVRFNETLTTCTSFDFQGLAYTNFTGIVQWHWDFGDGNTANTQNTSHNYTTAGPFQVKLVATDINGCKDSAVKEINPNASIANAGKDTAFCSNGPVTFTLHGNAGGTTYAWTPAAVLNNPALQEPTATISVSTRFYLTVTNAVLGCSAIDSVDITINPLPVVQTLGDTSFCRNVPLVLTTTPGMVSYEWTPAGSVSNPNISNPVYTDPYSQTLHVTGTDINGCKGEDIVNVTVKPVPVVSTIADTTICSTQTVTLFTTGAASYTWSPPTGLSDPTSPNPVFSGTSGQTYTVTGTAANGCSAQDVVTITVNVPVPFVQPPGKTMCSTTSVMLDGANGTGMQYTWSPGTYLSNTSIINPVANPPFTTIYDLLVTDKVCARNASFNVVVTVVDRPVVNARKSGDIDCAHRSVVLSAEGGNTYLWTPATGLSNPNSPNPVANPDHDQTYTVTVTNSANCTNTGSVTVLNKKAASLARYIPSAFTPNGDGLNDCYGIKNWQYIKKLQFLIYNRWGELVFYTTRQGACWDGNYRGKKAEEGTYVYYIKAETECGTEEQRGNVILIR